MTREEIKNIVCHVFHFYEVNAENCNWTDMNEACGEIFKALEQESIIDKIRAEIKHIKDNPLFGMVSNNTMLEVVLEIIDKHKAESEEE